VLGHPYVDIWQAVKPTRLGLAGWPEVPRTLEWKHGICTALGLPHRHQADLAAAWRMILDQVRSWDNLERPLLTVVEQLIDFVTEDHPRCRRGPTVGLRQCSRARSPKPPGHLYGVAFFMSVLPRRRGGPLACFTARG
jgi:hypothetical protein